jgi:hypothetical protein
MGRYRMRIEISFDPGNGVSSIYDGKNMYHSISASGRVPMGGLHIPDRQVLKIRQDGRYTFGPTALKEAQGRLPSLGAEGRYYDGFTRRMLLSLLHTHYSGQEVDLATMLPIHYYNDKNIRTKVKESFIGSHQIEDKQFTIKNVTIKPEGVTALGLLIPESDTSFLIIDCGQFTTNVISVFDKSVAPDSSFSIPIGVERIVELVRESQECNYMFARKTVRKRECKDEETFAGKEIRNALQSRLRTADKYDRLVVVGGGSYYFTEYLEGFAYQRIPVNEPEYANVKGLHALTF